MCARRPSDSTRTRSFTHRMKHADVRVRARVSVVVVPISHVRPGPTPRQPVYGILIRVMDIILTWRTLDSAFLCVRPENADNGRRRRVYMSLLFVAWRRAAACINWLKHDIGGMWGGGRGVAEEVHVSPGPELVFHSSQIRIEFVCVLGSGGLGSSCHAINAQFRRG